MAFGRQLRKDLLLDQRLLWLKAELPWLLVQRAGWNRAALWPWSWGAAEATSGTRRGRAVVAARACELRNRVSYRQDRSGPEAGEGLRPGTGKAGVPGTNLHPSSSTNEMPDLSQVTRPLSNSISSSAQRDNEVCPAGNCMISALQAI